MRQSPSPITAVSLAYFTYYGAIGCFFPFIGVHFRQLGLDGTQIGVLMTVPAIGVAVFAPLWGMLADRFDKHRLVMRMSLAPAAVAAATLAFADSFSALLFVSAVWAFFVAPSASIIDSYAVAISEQFGVAFGRLRLWGTLGFIAGVALLGWWMGDAVDSRFLLVYAACLLCTAAATLAFPAIHRHTRRMTLQDVGDALRRPVLVGLLAAYFVLSIALSTVNQYFGIYMTELGASARLLSTSSVLLAVAELPILFGSARIVERFGSRRMLMAAMLVYAFRFAVYSLLRAPEWVLPVQLLNGLSFGMLVLAITRLAHEFSGPQLTATAQGLLASAQATGSIIGLFTTGALLDVYGIFAIFRGMALVSLLAFVIFRFGLRRSATAPLSP